MLAARTPILGIAIAMLILIAENVGAVAYVARTQAIDVPAEVRRADASEQVESQRVPIDLGQPGCRH